MKSEINSQIYKVLTEMDEYLEEITIIGGICSAFYHEIKKRPIPEGLYSQDLDIGANEKRVAIGERTINECLNSAELKVSEIPHYRNVFITKYIPDDQSRSDHFFEVEFLLPLTGSGEKPMDRVGQLQGDITAKRLRYLDLLLHNQFKAEIELQERTFEILLPNPGTFIVHKLLSSEKRDNPRLRLI